MEKELLKGILDEIKSLRKDTVEGLDQTNTRIDITNEELEELRESVIVFQGGVSDLRYEMQGVKQILGEKVIWQNDNIILQKREGQAICGIIKRATKE